MFLSRKALRKRYLVSHKRNKRSAWFLVKPTLWHKKIGTKGYFLKGTFLNRNQYFIQSI